MADDFVSGREPVVLRRAKKPVGRPTLYSPDIAEEFCGLLVDGMTIAKACAQPGMPVKRTIFVWKKKYPEFKRKYDLAIEFRNQCLMDDCIDIADDTAADAGVVIENGTASVRMLPEKTAQRKLRCDQRWKQLQGMGLKAARHSGDKAEVIEGTIECNDPIYRQLCQWEIEAQKRRSDRHENGKDGATSGQGSEGRHR